MPASLWKSIPEDIPGVDDVDWVRLDPEHAALPPILCRWTELSDWAVQPESGVTGGLAHIPWYLARLWREQT